MTKRLLIVALLATVVGCSSRSPSQAGQPDENARTLVVPLALQPPPVYALIGYRDRLELSSAQVTTLDSIATAARDANSALLNELEEKAITTSRAPGVLQVEPSERPLLNQIRANNRRVLDEVSAVLTEEQRVEVCELYEPDRSRGREPARARRRDAQDEFMRGREAEPDSSNYLRGFTMWPWCRDGE